MFWPQLFVVEDKQSIKQLIWKSHEDLKTCEVELMSHGQQIVAQLENFVRFAVSSAAVEWCKNHSLFPCFILVILDFGTPYNTMTWSDIRDIPHSRILPTMSNHLFLNRQLFSTPCTAAILCSDWLVEPAEMWSALTFVIKICYETGKGNTRKYRASQKMWSALTFVLKM